MAGGDIEDVKTLLRAQLAETNENGERLSTGLIRVLVVQLTEGADAIESETDLPSIIAGAGAAAAGENSAMGRKECCDALPPVAACRSKRVSSRRSDSICGVRSGRGRRGGAAIRDADMFSPACWLWSRAGRIVWSRARPKRARCRTGGIPLRPQAQLTDLQNREHTLR